MGKSFIRFKGLFLFAFLSSAVVLAAGPKVKLASCGVLTKDGYACSSTLLDAGLLLTAAHCLDGIKNKKNVRVHCSNSPQKVDRFVVYHGYKPKIKGVRNIPEGDLALIFFNKKIKPKKLPYFFSGSSREAWNLLNSGKCYYVHSELSGSSKVRHRQRTRKVKASFGQVSLGKKILDAKGKPKFKVGMSGGGLYCIANNGLAYLMGTGSFRNKTKKVNGLSYLPDASFASWLKFYL